jgi:hypothetical protein
MAGRNLRNQIPGSLYEFARRAAGASPRGKKTPRGNQADCGYARARNGWGSDQGSEMAPPSHPENRPATPSAEDPRQRQHRTAVVEKLTIRSSNRGTRTRRPDGCAISSLATSSVSENNFWRRGTPSSASMQKKGNDWKLQEPRGWLGEAAAVGHARYRTTERCREQHQSDFSASIGSLRKPESVPTGLHRHLRSMYSFSQLSKHGRETASIEEILHEEFAGWANVLLKRVCAVQVHQTDQA